MHPYRKQLILYFIFTVLGFYLVTLHSTASNDFDLLLKDALHGDTSAQLKLGEMYYEGIGVLQDYSKAHAWFRIMAVFGDNSSADRINQLQKSMTDDELYEAINEYNNIYNKISNIDFGDQELFENGKIINCNTANHRILSLQRKDQDNFKDNSTLMDFCQLAEASITIWTEIKNIVDQCPELDESGSEGQFAKESIYWATETKLRTCSN